MKKLLIIVLLAFSCNETDDTIAPAYDSVEGSWQFTHKNISAEFDIVSYDEVLTLDNGTGFFVIDGQKYSVSYKIDIKWDPPSTITLNLQNPGATILLMNVDYNKDFTTLTSPLWVYSVLGEGEIKGLDTLTVSRR